MNLAPFKHHYAWVILAIGTSVTFSAIGLARFGYSVILPSMQTAFNMNNTQAGILATANLSSYLVLSAIGGALASRYSSRVIITTGLLCAGVGMILTGLSNNFSSAVIWRALTGIGSGASNVPVMAVMSTWFSKRYRGFASGVAVSGSSIALIIVGPLIPLILSIYGDVGWRVSWFILGAVNVSLSILACFLIRDDPSEKGILPFGSRTESTSRDQNDKHVGWSKLYSSPDVWHLAMVYFCFGFSYTI